MDMPLFYTGPPQTIPDQLGPGPLGYQQMPLGPIGDVVNNRIVNYNQPYKNLLLQGPASDSPTVFANYSQPYKNLMLQGPAGDQGMFETATVAPEVLKRMQMNMQAKADAVMEMELQKQMEIQKKK